eukprot:scaffold8641_cov134-Isochrysis_galbana.AAC.4
MDTAHISHHAQQDEEEMRKSRFVRHVAAVTYDICTYICDICICTYAHACTVRIRACYPMLLAYTPLGAAS